MIPCHNRAITLKVSILYRPIEMEGSSVHFLSLSFVAINGVYVGCGLPKFPPFPLPTFHLFLEGLTSFFKYFSVKKD